MNDPTKDEENPSKDSIEAKMGRIADEYTRELAAGKNPSIEEYCRRYPLLADTIRMVFPFLGESQKTKNSPTDLDPTTASPTKLQSIAESISDYKSPQPKIVGDYELVRELGHGGMGIVYEARQISLDKRVALKIPFAGALHPKGLLRFINEAKAAAQLQHPNIVEVYGVGCDGGTYFYAMQYIEGSNLAEVIRQNSLQQEHRGGATTPRAVGGITTVIDTELVENKRPRKTTKSIGLLSFKTFGDSGSNAEYLHSLVEVAIQTADALQHAHETGVVHRDIKPSNLMLDTDGNIWVTDFGLAQVQGNESLTATGEPVGTLRYMSPEQALAKQVIVDHRTDIYSLGATLYELLTLRPVHDGTTRQEILRQIAFDEPIIPSRVDRRIPLELSTIVVAALAKNPNERYQSAQEMADDLRRFKSDIPIKRRPPNVVQRIGKWARRHRAAVSTVAGIGMILFMATTVSLWFIAQAWAAEHDKRTATEQLLEISEGLRLATQSMLELPKNPGLAVALSIEGRKKHESHETNNALLQALNENHELKTLRGHTGAIGNVSRSSDGRKVVSTMSSAGAKAIDQARVWDVETGAFRPLLSEGKAITSAAFSPRSGRILAAASSQSARDKPGDSREIVGAAPCIFDATTGEVLQELKDAFLFEAQPNCFSSNGQFVVVPTLGKKATIYDVIDGRALHDLVGHADRVNYSAYSPSGKFIVTISADKTVRIWNASTQKELHNMAVWTRRAPYTALFSPDERFLATGSSVGSHLWDVVTGQRLNQGEWSGEIVRFSNDSKKLLLANSLQVQAIDLETRKPLFVATDIESFIRTVEISPLGNEFAVACGKIVQIRQLADGKLLSTLRGHDKQVSTIAYASTGRTLVSGSIDGTIRHWRIDDGAAISRLTDKRLEGNSAIASSADGKKIAISSDVTLNTYVFQKETQEPQVEFPGLIDTHSRSGSRLAIRAAEQVIIWDHSIKREVAAHKHATGNVRDVRLAAGGTLGVLCFQDGRVGLWNIRNNHVRELPGISGVIQSAAFNSDGTRLATGGFDGTVRLWRVAGMEIERKWELSTVVQSIEFSPRDDRLVATTNRESAYIFSVAEDVGEINLHAPQIVMNRALFSVNGEYVVTYHTLNNKSIVCWRVADGKLVHQFDETSGEVFVSLSQQRNELVVASTLSGVFTWDFADNKFVRLTDVGAECAMFSPDERQIVAASFVSFLAPEFMASPSTAAVEGSVLQFWDAASKKLASTSTQMMAVMYLDYLPSGEILAVGRRFGVEVIEMESRNKLTDIKGHAAPVSAILFSKGSDVIVTASYDHTAAIWDAMTGKLLRRLVGHSSPITALTLHAQNNELATATSRGEVIVWKVSTGEPLALPSHAGHVFQIAFDKQGNRVITNSRDGSVRVWNRTSGTTHTIQRQDVLLNPISVSSDDRLIAVPVQITAKVNPKTSPSPVDTKHILYFSTWESEPVKLEHDASARSAEISTDGRQAISIDSEGALCIWSLEPQPSRRLKLLDPNSPFSAGFFSPDGKRIVARQSDQLVLLDSKTGELLANYNPGTQSNFGLKGTTLSNPFTLDGKWIVARDQQSCWCRWPTDILSYAESLSPMNLTESQRTTYRIR